MRSHEHHDITTGKHVRAGAGGTIVGRGRSRLRDWSRGEVEVDEADMDDAGVRAQGPDLGRTHPAGAGGKTIAARR
jgi:hypothetical protein